MSIDEKDLASAFAGNVGLPESKTAIKPLPYRKHETIRGILVPYCPCGKGTLSKSVDTEWHLLNWCSACGQRYYNKKTQSSTEQRDNPCF